jgi:Asp-tRNA(Asn)/Glu-tRNA(Gln) amidotransferase A subunit family amidase
MHANAISDVEKRPSAALWQAPFTALAPLMARGALTSQALLAQCRAAIAAYDGGDSGLGALIYLNPQADAEAKALDVERERSGVRGPLHGIPVVLKDNIDVAGWPTTSGSRAMARAVALQDAVQTARLRAGGALIIGKANLSEFSFEVRSRSSIRGDVRNPFDRHVTAGGSSGGTAVAVAAGFASAGLGTDTGGSLRIPASFTGLVALRPTQGLLDMTGVAPLAPSADTIGPITRSVADAASLFALLGGAGASAAAGLPTRTLAGARIGVLRQAFGVEDEIRRATEAALTAMSRAGAKLIDPVELPPDLCPVGCPEIVDFEFCPAFDAYLQERFVPGTAPASLATIYAGGEFLPDYRESLARRLNWRSLAADRPRELKEYRRRVRQAVAASMDRHALDAWVYPTAAVTPRSLDNPAVGWAAELAACIGWPALTLPAGRAVSGVPIGLELLGPANAETALLDLAADLENCLKGRPIPLLDGAR